MDILDRKVSKEIKKAPVARSGFAIQKKPWKAEESSLQSPWGM